MPSRQDSNPHSFSSSQATIRLSISLSLTPSVGPARHIVGEVLEQLDHRHNVGSSFQALHQSCVNILDHLCAHSSILVTSSLSSCSDPGQQAVALVHGYTHVVPMAQLLRINNLSHLGEQDGPALLIH